MSLKGHLELEVLNVKKGKESSFQTRVQGSCLLSVKKQQQLNKTKYIFTRSRKQLDQNMGRAKFEGNSGDLLDVEAD